MVTMFIMQMMINRFFFLKIAITTTSFILIIIKTFSMLKPDIVIWRETSIY